jgi:hypothetical protein
MYKDGHDREAHLSPDPPHEGGITEIDIFEEE